MPSRYWMCWMVRYTCVDGIGHSAVPRQSNSGFEYNQANPRCAFIQDVVAYLRRLEQCRCWLRWIEIWQCKYRTSLSLVDDCVQAQTNMAVSRRRSLLRQSISLSLSHGTMPITNLSLIATAVRHLTLHWNAESAG